MQQKASGVWKKSQRLPTPRHQLFFGNVIKHKTGIKPGNFHQGFLLSLLRDN